MSPGPEGLVFEKKGHRYRIDGEPVPSVTTILKKTGISTFPAHLIPKHILRRSRFRGNAVHAAIEKLERAYWDSDAPEVARPYLRAYSDWLDDTGWKVDVRERPVVSRVHRYAGRLDQLGWLDGARTILDMKTGTSAASGDGLEAARHQDAAYAIAWDEEFPDERVERAIVLTLTPKGYRPKEVDLAIYRPRFIDAVRRYYEERAQLTLEGGRHDDEGSGTR